MTRRLLLLQLASLAAVAQITAPPSDLDQWVARAMQQFEIPGAAVAIVKDGKTVFEKGYGVRRLGSPERVDEHTLFGIASNTKAFTTAALAMLVEDGKLQWDDPVQAHLPGFQGVRSVCLTRTQGRRSRIAPERSRARRRRPAFLAGHRCVAL